MPDRLPAALSAVLPPDTAEAWLTLSTEIPRQCVLFGGTATAAHLHHRVSRDLDFFFDGDVDLQQVASRLRSLRKTAISDLDDDTLNAVFGATKVQFLRSTGQTDIEEPSKIAGIKVAGLRDLMATKLKVILDRGELRDYFDVMVLDQRYPQAVERGLTDYRQRYADQNDNNLFGIIRSLGYLADVTDDPGLPVPRADIESFWQRRQPEVIRNLQSMETNP